MCFLLSGGRRRVVVTNDAVWGGETEVVGEESGPGDGWVEGVEKLVESFLFCWVKERLVLREGKREEEEKEKEGG